MRMLLIVVVSFLVPASFGCSMSSKIARMDAVEIKTVDSWDLCVAYKARKTPTIREEIKRRDLLSELDWATVDANKIAIGMTGYGLYASWGRPSDRNTTVTASGTHSQWVYSFETSQGVWYYSKYAYLDNGIVTSWQY